MPIETQQEKNTYHRDKYGLLYCHICGFQPPVKRVEKDGKEILRQNKSTLKYHLDIHKGQLPHVCKVCNKGFLHKNVLENHIQAIHSTPDNTITYRCNVPGCDFTSIQKGNLIIHKSRKHCLPIVDDYLIKKERENSVIFHCSCCSVDYNSGSNFHHHILKCLHQHGVAIPVSLD